MKKLIAAVIILSTIFCIAKIYGVYNPYTRDMVDTVTFRDFEEDVIYAWYQSGLGAGMTPMLTKYGNIKPYSKFSEKYRYTHDILDTTIFVDFEEMTMYTWYGSDECAGMSIMSKKDSSPKIYNRETSIYKDIRDLSETTIFVYEPTKVMFTWYREKNGGGISKLLKADGMPKLYDKSTSKYTNVRYITDDMIFVDWKTRTMFFCYEEDGAGDIAIIPNPNGTHMTLDKLPFKYFVQKQIEDTKTFVDKEENVEYMWFRGQNWGGLTEMPK